MAADIAYDTAWRSLDEDLAASRAEQARLRSFFPGLRGELHHFRRMAEKSAGLPEAAREHALWVALAAEVEAYLAPPCEVVSLFADLDELFPASDDPG